MITEWTKHLKDPQEKAEFEQYVKSTKRLLERLTQLIDEREYSLDRSETDMKSFDQPNWDYKQAYKNGFRACLNIMKKLVDIDHSQPKETK